MDAFIFSNMTCSKSYMVQHDSSIWNVFNKYASLTLLRAVKVTTQLNWTSHGNCRKFCYWESPTHMNDSTSLIWSHMLYPEINKLCCVLDNYKNVNYGPPLWNGMRAISRSFFVSRILLLLHLTHCFLTMTSKKTFVNAKQ